MKKLTFKDFYDYTLTAERNEYGLHEIENDGSFPKYAFHIYDNNLQVNVNCQKDTDDMYTSIGNFIFNPEEDDVTIYPVINGNCNYNCGLTFTMYTEIDVNEGSNLWYTWLGPKGKTIKDLLVNTINA